MILLIVSLLTAQGSLAVDENLAANKTRKLVENIRRQLMENNYDYLPSEEEVVFPTQHYDQDLPNDPLYNDNDTLAESIERQDRADAVHRVEESREDSKTSDAVSKKDLLYYVHDDRLREAERNNVAEPDGGDDFDDVDDSNRRARYKVLKVKDADPSRRSNSYRRFVQEENADGVAIISLDGEPFPEFHLPHGRRQYMQEAEAEAESGDLIDNARNNSTQGVDDSII